MSLSPFIEVGTDAGIVILMNIIPSDEWLIVFI